MNAVTTSEASKLPGVSFPEVTRDEVFRIETPRLWLRWPAQADAANIAAFAGLPEVAKMTSSWPEGVSVEEVQKRIKDVRRWNGNGERLILVIALKASPETAIGQIGLDAEDDGTLGLGYHLSPDYWGQGLVSEALAKFITLAFWLTDASAIKADVRTINPASRRVLQKAGFVKTGTQTAKCGLRGLVEKESYRLARGSHKKRHVV